MKIIAESGATKTAWRSVDGDGRIREALTAGLSPTCIDAEHINGIIRNAVPAINPEGRRVEEVFFYGAGLVSDESSEPLRSALQTWCPFAHMEFHSDILAAARALFGNGSGIVAIMGTGSNSCLYEDGQIVRNIRPGGYVLGDEGSGVSLGRAFLADYVKDMLPEQIRREFVASTGLDYSSIVRKVYKEPGASAFMASLAPFVLSYVGDPYVDLLVRDNLESFVRRSLSRYLLHTADKEAAPGVGVVGSFGYACKEMLKEVGADYGLEFVSFLKEPIDELLRYHSEYVV